MIATLAMTMAGPLIQFRIGVRTKAPPTTSTMTATTYATASAAPSDMGGR